MSTETTPPVDASTRRGELLRAKLAARKLRVGAGRADRITRAPRPATGPIRFPLTATQRRMWFAHQLDPTDVSTTLCRVLRLRGPLDVDRLAEAARLLVARHEVLRSTFHRGDGVTDEPYQQVGAVPDQVLILADVPSGPLDVDERAAALARHHAGAPFDLAGDQPLRLVLERLADDDHLLLLAVHHVACDDASWQLLVGELGAGYRHSAERSGAIERIQVGDVAVWQRDSAGSAGDRASLLYWRERLDGLPTPAVPAPDRVPAARPETGWVSAELDAPVAEALGEHVRRGKTTAFTVLLAAFLTVLHRRTGAEDLAVGSPVSGRDRAELTGVVGDFGNTVVLRTSVTGQSTFPELLARTREVVLGALDHQELPFDSVVEHLALAGGRTGRPRADRLFRIMFLTYDDELTEGSPFGVEVALEEIRVPPHAAQFDLVIAMSRGADRIHAESTYRGDRYDPASVATLFDQMARVLVAALAEPDTPLGVLPLGPAETGPAETGPALRKPRLPRLNPAPVAVTEPSGRTVPAAEVTARAHRLARELIARGAGPEQRVVVALRPSADLVATQWALHLTGAVFVPVDPRHPAARTAQVVSGVAPLAVVTELAVARRLDEALGSAPRLVVDDCPSLAGRSGAPLGDRELREASRPKHAAYVIHTSGSTGAPKGVVVTRANLAAMLSSTSAAVPGRLLRGGGPLGPDDVWSVTHSAAFDFSVWEIWGAMAHGSRLVLVDPDDARSPRALARVLVEHGVTVLSQTPSAFAGLVAADAEDPELLAGNALRLVVFGGESLEPELVRRWYRRYGADSPRLVNMYGITETTVHASVRPLDPSSVAELPGGWSGTPIGQALPGQWLDVVDPNGRPVPTGVLGELWVGGPGVSRGYLGDRERTEARFGKSGTRYYRSGDLARRAPDGELLHLGRIDDQISLRGFRIEPGEVAHAVARAVAGPDGSRPSAGDVAVLVREDRAADPRLVAVVATAGLPEPALARLRDVSALRAELAASVIESMVPSSVLTVDRLPLTASGKLDKAVLRALPLTEESRPISVRRPPEGSAQEVVASAFAEVLGVPEGTIGADDDFFALGGHSLLAVRLAGVLRTAFGGEVDVRTVFQAPTVAGLTRAAFEDAGGPARPPLVAADRPARSTRPTRVPRVPIAELAHGLWFLHRVDPTSPAYHVPIELHLSGRIDVVALRSAVNDVVARHESLRTVYPRGHSGPEQLVLPAYPVELPEYTDLEPFELDRLLAEPFELADTPPVRALLVWPGSAGHGPDAGDDVRADPGADPRADVRADSRADPGADPRPPRGAAPQQPNHTGPTISGAAEAGYPQAEPAGPPSATLVLCLHHIAADEGSLAPLVSDLATAYTARVSGNAPSWAPLPVQHTDWALWHTELLGPDEPGSLRRRQRDYWVDTLAGAPERLELPLDRPRPSVRDSHGERIPLEVPAPVRAALGALATRCGASTFMVLHAALAAVLTRFGAGHDITVGSPVGRRTEPELAGVVGYFVNTVVLRTDTSGDPTFAELVGRSRDAALGAYANADLPFEQVVRAVAPRRAASGTPLFQVMLSYAAGRLPAPELPGLDVTVAPRTTATAKFDLTLTLAEHTEPGPDGATAITGMLGYRTDVFDAATARRIARAWSRVLRQVTDDPDTRIGQLDVLGAERDRVLREWNSTAAPVPVDDLLDQVRVAAVATPEATAVVGADGAEVGYRELVGSAHRLGHLLRSRRGGAGTGEHLIGVLLPRSPELVTALLGVLAADAAFVAIDVGLPAARVRELCSPLHAVVTDSTHRELVEGLPAIPVIELDAPDVREALSGHPVEAPPRRAGTELPTGDRAAYVVYTSGSTGVPKGAVIVHRAIASRLAWQRAKLGLGADDAVLHKAPLTFDISINELFLPLTAGARLVLAEASRHGDLAHLLDVIDTRRVTFVYLTASMLEVLLNTPGASQRAASLRHLWCGGEKMTAALLTRTREVLDVTLYHGYGPAEATIGVCSETHPVGEPGEITEITLGRPNPNTALYALDERLQPVPPGVAGELYIGGILLGRGYLGDPRRTAERFVADPFGSGGRLYATGDLVRYRDDGRLEFLGRRDNQVKVRGARVELEEIEQVLVSHPGVRQAASVLLNPGPSARLAVAWVPESADRRSEDAVQAADVVRWLSERLAISAVPSVAQAIAELPLFPSGKVNRALLADWLAASEASDRVPSEPPRGEREELVASVWADVLGVGTDRIGARDGFFEVGGNSLLMVVVQQRLAEVTGHEVALLDLMSHPTVAQLARLLDRSDEAPADSGVGRARARAAQARKVSRRRVARASWTDETEEGSA